ncbi:hypothetical protein K504DRAFT_529828 [Pleomassaria siparia CBS 279.74]|uniref:RNA-dependent RNA polymerase n=1 Tax=Pleomassaria siparia CBS 279.74 TaxID=1314801 RepID=A0A6G1KS70_9PLEO|nr:hypothetical protein K504DRAFT_529828 [Pleomassaria siparia CBS 279.74]
MWKILPRPTPPPQGSHGLIAPATPHRVGAADPINDIIRSLENSWRLGLRIRDQYWSPSAGPKSTPDIIYGRIKFLYYHDQSTLNQRLEDFKRIAPKTARDGQLDLLLTLLPLPTGTPKSSARDARTQSPPGGGHRAQSFRSQLSGQVPQSPQHEDAQRESVYMTAPESGSPTDEDEDDFAVPDSPTPSSKSAQRRVQASPRVSFGSAGRKRLSEISNDNATSHKVAKTSKGKQPTPKSLFKKPSIDLLRSFQSASATASLTTSMNTSFNTDSTPMSSQRSATQALTTNTSFASDMGDTKSGHPRFTRTSSTTMGSLDDDDFLDVSAQLEQEMFAQLERENLRSSGSERSDPLQSSSTRESLSTFGSIDEAALLETSFRVEAGVTSPNAKNSPAMPFLQTDGATLVDLTDEEELPEAFLDIRAGVQSPKKRFLRSDRVKLGTPSPNFNLQTSVSPSRHIGRPRSPRNGSSRTRFSSQFPAAIPETVRRNPPRDLHDELSASEYIPESPRTTAQDQDPKNMSYYILRIPEQHLFVEDISSKMKLLPYFVLFICMRIAIEFKVPIHDLAQNLGEQWSDPESFWNMVTKRCPQMQAGGREPKSLWAAQKRSLDGYTFKGQVVLNKRLKGPVFNLKLFSVAADLSCRFQRHFGADRFLFLGFPSFKQSLPPRFGQTEMKQIEQQWNEWLCKEHSFLGRKWTAFHREPIKAKGGVKNDSSDTRIILFATEGYGIEPIPIENLVNWFYPLSINRDENFPKAFSRLSLGLSRTTPTLAFKPSQIRYERDTMADRSPEDTRYNDADLAWHDDYEDKVVMNDGCSLMSVGAAHAIWKLYKKAVDTQDPLPSAFQGRIGGAKGVWMVSAESYSRDAYHRSIWIKINKSQLKFKPHPEDLSDKLPYDPDRLTFEICAYSKPPDSSDLHTSFITIMEDRGVPKEVVARFVKERLDLERAQLLGMIADPLKMYDWIFKQSSRVQNSEEIRWQAALPHSLPDKIKLLFENGFNPVDAPYLARSLQRFIQQEQLWMESKLRIPLGKAAFLLGVADPTQILAPGEIHVQFSRPFIDSMADESFRYLNDIDVLVARQPACRRSDIQRVQATTRPELAHLVDIVVFSSRGKYPLAGKLQGGDYDGDIFWLCWEPALVEPFKNAPAPTRKLDPVKYGIKTEKRKLHEVMDPDNLSTTGNFLKESMAFRSHPSLLGRVTKFLEKQSYRENRIQSSRLNSLHDMHDLLVDATKQGYIYTEQDWSKFIRYTLRCGKPNIPAYIQAMEACEKVKEMGEVDRLQTRNWKPNDANIIDFLYFRVVRIHDVETLKMVTIAFPKDSEDDLCLQYPYFHAQEMKSPAMEIEIKLLRNGVDKVYQEWNRGIMNNPEDGTANNYNRTVEECYKLFCALEPTQPDDLEVKTWTRPFLSDTFSMWKMLRASLLYTRYPRKIPFVWHMAGRELAELKCKSIPGSRSVYWPIHKILRPKLRTIPRRSDGDRSDDEEDVPVAIGDHVVE